MKDKYSGCEGHTSFLNFCNLDSARIHNTPPVSTGFPHEKCVYGQNNKAEPKQTNLHVPFIKNDNPQKSRIVTRSSKSPIGKAL